MLLGQVHVVGGGEVAEEVALAHGQFPVESRGFFPHGGDDAFDPVVQLLAAVAVAGRGGGLAQGLAEPVELVEVLLEAEGALQRGQETFGYGRQRRLPAQHRADEREARPHKRFLARHRAGNVVVAAAVGDPAPEHIARPIQDDGLGGGRAQVDANVDFGCAHAPTLVPRLCSNIWR